MGFFLTRKAKAARARAAARKLSCRSQRIPQELPTSLSTQRPPIQSPMEMIVQDDEVFVPKEPLANIKQEPIEIQDVQCQPESLEEVKMEQLEEELELKDVPFQSEYPEAVDVDSIREQQMLTDGSKTNSGDQRCQFCLRLLQEAGGRGRMSQRRIVFVLGLKKWRSTQSNRPVCCTDCKEKFDLFFEFKTSCLEALAHSNFLSECVEKNLPEEMEPEEMPITSEYVEPVDAPQECQICNVAFLERAELITHMLTHAGVGCRKGCNRIFYQEQDRTEHEQICGKQAHRKCTKCKAIFPTKSALTAHMTEAHTDPKFFCEVCNIVFHKKYIFQRHAEDAHSMNSKCGICGKLFFSCKALRVHQRVHAERPYICPNCGSTYKYNYQLQAHLNKRQCVGSASGEKDFIAQDT